MQKKLKNKKTSNGQTSDSDDINKSNANSNALQACQTALKLLISVQSIVVILLIQ